MIATRYRNRRIGEFLKELHLVEGRNTGIPTILNALRYNGSPLPAFETDEDRSFFRVTLYIHDEFINETYNNNSSKLPTKRRKKEDVKAIIINELIAEPLASQELAIKAGYSTHRSGAYFRIIGELIDEGKIAFTNPNNPHDKNQKLCLVNT
jgi:ATP-dependent DNA helicase RecG